MRWLIVAILEALAVLTASGAEPPRYVVENKIPAFTVVNKVSTAPAQPRGEWRRFTQVVNGQIVRQWDAFVPEPTASGVAVQPRPFQPSPTTQPTVARIVATSPQPVQAPGSYGAIYPAGSIYMNANGVVLNGDTNCVSGFR